MSVTVGILVFDGVDELDFVGPLDVFGAAGYQRDDTKIVTIGSRGREFRGGHGLRCIADVDITNAPPLDVVIVPGGFGTDELAKDTAVLDWLRGVSRLVRWTCSVCTGSFVLQAAGLTERRRITTHSGAIEPLRAARSGDVIEGERYVVDGNLVTSAGVSAGIDMAIWLVGQLYGEGHARTVIRSLDYYPEPPY